MSTMSADILSDLQKLNGSQVLGLDSQGNQMSSVQSQYSQAFAPAQQQQQMGGGGMLPISSTPQVPSFQQQQQMQPPPFQMSQQQQQQQQIPSELIRKFVYVISSDPQLQQQYGANLTEHLKDANLMTNVINQYNNFMAQQQQQQQQAPPPPPVQQPQQAPPVQQSQGNGNGNENGNEIEDIEPLDKEETFSDKLWSLIKLPLIATIIYAILNLEYVQKHIIGFIPKLGNGSMHNVGFALIFFLVLSLVIEVTKYL